MNCLVQLTKVPLLSDTAYVNKFVVRQASASSFIHWTVTSRQSAWRWGRSRQVAARPICCKGKFHFLIKPYKEFMVGFCYQHVNNRTAAWLINEYFSRFLKRKTFCFLCCSVLLDFFRNTFVTCLILGYPNQGIKTVPYYWSCQSVRPPLGRIS